jgi:hypothetical protein
MSFLRDILHPTRFFYLRSRRKEKAFGMTSRQEQRWLRTYAARDYQGSGAIVDLGCFFGATTIALAEGLALNSAARQKAIHAYDLFIWDEDFEIWARGREVEGQFRSGESFLADFLRRTAPWREFIVVHQEDLMEAQWRNGPIEFLLVDAMKTPETASAILRGFFPHLIPGNSFVAQQDFAHCYTPWIHLLTYRLRNYFSVATDLPASGTTVFRCEKEIPLETVTMNLSPTASSTEEIEAAFDYSLKIASERKKGNVVAAKAMAYIERGEIDRAREIVAQTKYGPDSIAGELEQIKTDWLRMQPT